MKAGDCKHFTGIQHATCEAGLSYETVKGDAALLPCLPSVRRRLHQDHHSVASCEKFCALTPEEEAASHEETLAHLRSIAAGISPCCNAPVDERDSGWTYCSACKKALVHYCRRGGR